MFGHNPAGEAEEAGLGSREACLALPPVGRDPASKEEWLPVRYVRIMLKLTEVLFALFKLAGDNWSTLLALATCMAPQKRRGADAPAPGPEGRGRYAALRRRSCSSDSP